ncbi:hypothetical protein VCR15J2_390051 [Vibrio coralliirubri]|nr:hypothetical protein VCR15J2_390051 [Vibrio coralliirubri]
MELPPPAPVMPWLFYRGTSKPNSFPILGTGAKPYRGNYH